MLVLSRRQNEKILLPGIHTSIEVVDVKGDRVRLGIDAPSNVTILREEVARRSGISGTQSPLEGVQLSLRKERHELRNQLNFASVGLALARRQLQAGLLDHADATLEKLSGGFENMSTCIGKLVGTPQVDKAAPKALLVEDDHNECELLAGFFRLAGYDVATAEDGAVALDYLHANETPDVMLLDMMLPRCDGPTTVRLVRQEPALSKLKIFAMSGYAPDEVGVDCASAGIERWFRKPLNPEALLRELTIAA